MIIERRNFMNRKFSKVSNITQIFIWSIVLVLAIFAAIYIGLVSFGGDEITFANSLGWFANIIVYPFALPLIYAYNNFVSPIIMFISGLIIVAVVLWLLICAIINAHKRSNSEAQSIISFGFGIVGLIFAKFSLFFVMETHYVVESLAVCGALIVLFIYIIITAFINIRKKI